ncbi:MAG: NADPH-dependent glutamate synthase [Elusimicrobiota bacterium]
MKTKQVSINEMPLEKRMDTFDEVILGYNEEQAVMEAGRCLQCKNPVCIEGCPVGINIKQFIEEIKNRKFLDAYKTIKEKNNFPSVCGRVCPAEFQCRKACVLTKKGERFASDNAINIHFLERFAGDYGKEHESDIDIKLSKTNGKKVAVVGSGPAGLCVAGELARKGVKVVIFESLHTPGGVLRYGIPPFRLPGEILDFEINYLKKLGVEIVQNYIIGRTGGLRELFKKGFSAVFLGLGAGTPAFMKIPGENLCNVYSANEFLTRVNLMSAYKFPEYHTPINIGKSMLVIGGGNTAMDSARVALRLQKLNGLKPNVTIVYRRTEEEMPARRLELSHAKEEGIIFKVLVQPISFIGDENNYVKKMRSLKCALGDLDKSGRPRPVPIKNSEFDLDCDVAIIAIGLKANKILTRETQDLKIDAKGDLIVNRETMETSISGVYAGGDIVGGEGTVIEAMGMGKTAAESILKYIS